MIFFFSVGKAESTHTAPTYSQEYGTGGEHILSACPWGHWKVLLCLLGREEERYWEMLTLTYPWPPADVRVSQNTNTFHLPTSNPTAPFVFLFQKETTSQGLGAHIWKAEYEGPWRIPRAEMISSSPVLWNLSHTLTYYGQWNGAKYSHNYKTGTTKTLISPRGPIQSPNQLLPSLSCSLQPKQPPLPLEIHNKNPDKLLFALFLWAAARAPTLFGT